jgi:hypothetical protein
LNVKKHTPPTHTRPGKQPKPKNQTQNNQKMGWETHTENPSSQKKKQNLEKTFTQKDQITLKGKDSEIYRNNPTKNKTNTTNKKL